MSKFLRDLLDAEEPVFTLALRDLENATGKNGVDSRLVGDISAETRKAVTELGLGVGATGEEVYHALIARIDDDNKRVAKIVGSSDPDNIRETVPHLVAAANKVDFHRNVFVLKHDKAKEFLRAHPPKNLIEHLGYANIEELFEKENFGELYTALRFSEGPEWLNEYDELFKTVTADDYEERDIEIIVMNHDKYVDLAEHFVQKKLHNVTHTKEMGVIVVVPVRQERWKGLTLKTLPLLFHYMNEVKLYSTFFRHKAKSVRNFGEVVMETLIADPDAGAQIAGHHVHWRVIQRYFGKLKDEAHPEAFEPHVQPEDLHWRRAEELLYQIDPIMKFWKNRDWVGYGFDGQIVTLNVIDVALSYSNDIPFDARYIYHFRESLWNEIFSRYMGMPTLKKQILEQLDNDMIKPDALLRAKLKSKPQTVAELVKKAQHLKNANSKHDMLIRQKLIDSAEGRLIGVIEEFEKAFEVLEKYPKTVTVFGSARLPQDHPASIQAYEVAGRLAREGYAVVSGGGGGIMEAVNHGAYDNGGGAVGFNIKLPHEQKLNSYTTDYYTFEHFFARKVAMTLDGSAYIYFTGGFGTLDELFELITLEQTGRIPRVPIILVGKEFWAPLEKYISEHLDEEYHTISRHDKKLYTITDDIDEIVHIVKDFEGDARRHQEYSDDKFPA
jgi:uncharacterized protein (TIGR00730 family)